MKQSSKGRQGVGLAFPILCGLIIGTLAYWSYVRNEVFRSDIALWTNNLMHSPESTRVNNNLGSALMHERRYTEALPYLEKAVRLSANPRTDVYNYMLQRAFEARNNLGVTLVAVGRGPEAREHFNEAIRFLPLVNGFSAAGLHNNVALYLVSAKRYEEAVRHLEEAIRLYPKFEQAKINLERVKAGMNK